MHQTTSHIDLAALNGMDHASFVAALGPTFEHAPWVAQGAWAARPFASIEALHAAMLDVVRRAPPASRLAFLRGHPELAGREAQAGTMTGDSVREQASAGLDALTRDELAEVRGLNQDYRRRHGFPFILAVLGRGKREIFEELRRRCGRPTGVEFDEALAQIASITRLRLQARFGA